GLEIGLRAGRARRHRPGARFASERDQRNRAFAGGDGFRRMAEMNQVGTAAGIGGIDVAHLVEAEIIDHRPGAAGRVSGHEVAVDIVLGEPGILDRPLGDLGVQLCGGFVGCVPGRVLKNTGNVGLALDGQLNSPLAFLLSYSRIISWPARAALASGEIFRGVRGVCSKLKASSRRKPGHITTGRSFCAPSLTSNQNTMSWGYGSRICARYRSLVRDDVRVEGKSPHSRNAIAPELSAIPPSKRTEGAGKAGCLAHPQPRVQQKKHTSKHTTGTPKQPGLPCATVYGLLRALPGVRDLIVTVARRFVTRRLSASPGAPGPHVFAVRIGA